MGAVERAVLRPSREAKGSVGFWLFLGQLVTTFGIALSNFLLFFTLIWAAVRRRRLFFAAGDEAETGVRRPSTHQEKRQIRQRNQG